MRPPTAFNPPPLRTNLRHPGEFLKPQSARVFVQPVHRFEVTEPRRSLSRQQVDRFYNVEYVTRQKRPCAFCWKICGGCCCSVPFIIAASLLVFALPVAITVGLSQSKTHLICKFFKQQ